MPKFCHICEKTDKRAVSRSHSKVATIRKQKVNFQTKKIGGVKLIVCARCIRTMSKEEKQTVA